jgi:hypothetical protein
MISNKTARWNYEKCDAQTGTVVVGKSQMPSWWCSQMDGQRRKCVRVNYRGKVFFLDDEDGSGSLKVFECGGGPDSGHKSLPVDDESTFIPA